MHWRTPFPPKRPSLLAEMIALFRGGLSPEKVMAPELADEIPPADDVASKTRDAAVPLRSRGASYGRLTP